MTTVVAENKIIGPNPWARGLGMIKSSFMLHYALPSLQQYLSCLYEKQKKLEQCSVVITNLIVTTGLGNIHLAGVEVLAKIQGIQI